MRFADIGLSDGSKQTLSDFFSVDDAKLKALPDAEVLELFRSGMLGLIHAHLLSLANCQIELKDNKAARRSLEDLVKAYPGTEAAQAGKERLVII